MSDDAARLRALLEIAQLVGSARRLEDFIEVAADAARRALDAASLSVSRWDRETGMLRILCNVGQLGPGELRLPVDETYTIAGWDAMPELVERRVSFTAAVDDGTPEGEHLADRHKDSCMSVPIIVDARVWGELWASRVAGQPRYTAADLPFAEAIATQVGSGVLQADHLARIEALAFTDPLTGLANRRAVDERLDDAMSKHAVDGHLVSVILADINRLKQVNDTFGHEAGDRLIIAVADAVSRASGLSQRSLSARIGGDEFCVVIDGEPLTAVMRVAEELCRLVDGQPMSTGVSCGVASTEAMSGRVDSQTRLFRLADAAQYRAKRAGSHVPVLAGSSIPADPAGPPVERRELRGRLRTDIVGAFEAGLNALDSALDSPVQERLELVASIVCDLVDGAGWWVSRVDEGSTQLTTVATSIERHAGSSSAGAVVDQTYDLSRFPVSQRAIETASSWFMEAGDPGNDPAEEAELVAANQTALLAAGARGGSAGWLVEVAGDPISLPMRAFEPVLRGLVAVAVAGAVDVVPRAAAVRLPRVPDQSPTPEVPRVSGPEPTAQPGP